MTDLSSWGKYPKAAHNIIAPGWQTADFQAIFTKHQGTFLPHGLGRSYGDVCLNDGGNLLHTINLRHLISFDEQSGILRCEAGTSLAEILAWSVPRGWFLKVTPGTKFVTVGGAIANDVHGKNHHRSGTFGHCVKQFEIVRSDGNRYLCSPQSNPDLYFATIGGLGLTGLITWADVELIRLSSCRFPVELIQFNSLDEFLTLSDESDPNFDYIVSWVDCISAKTAGRGILMRSNLPTQSDKTLSCYAPQPLLNIPCDAPSWLLNRFTMGAFNVAYFNKQFRKTKQLLQHFEPFFYPLDIVLNWNRLYGKRGFLQYQLLIPRANCDAFRLVFKKIISSGQGSCLSVLKTCGDIKPAGLMSFPREGISLALDFPITGQGVFNLLDTLDSIVKDAQGTIYLAKDARLSAPIFKSLYPQWERFSTFIDPAFSSSMWRRFTQE